MKIIINTLGPQTTDSYRAAEYWIKKNKYENFEIVGYKSFESLFRSVKESQHIVMPLGYSNRNGQEFKGWVDFHFRFWDELEIYEVFELHTKEMVLLNNRQYKKNGIVIQSATYQLAKSTIDLEDRMFFYSPSKALALEEFLKHGYQYTICSKDNYVQKGLEKRSNYTIVKEYNPIMVWIVYRIVKNFKRVMIT